MGGEVTGKKTITDNVTDSGHSLGLTGKGTRDIRTRVSIIRPLKKGRACPLNKEDFPLQANVGFRHEHIYGSRECNPPSKGSERPSKRREGPVTNPTRQDPTKGLLLRKSPGILIMALVSYKSRGKKKSPSPCSGRHQRTWKANATDYKKERKPTKRT